MSQPSDSDKIKKLEEMIEIMAKTIQEQAEEIKELKRVTCKHPRAIYSHGYFSCDDCGDSGRTD